MTNGQLKQFTTRNCTTWSSAGENQFLLTAEGGVLTIEAVYPTAPFTKTWNIADVSAHASGEWVTITNGSQAVQFLSAEIKKDKAGHQMYEGAVDILRYIQNLKNSLGNKIEITTGFDSHQMRTTGTPEISLKKGDIVELKSDGIYITTKLCFENIDNDKVDWKTIFNNFLVNGKTCQ